MKPPRSELEFAAFLAYCPRGETKAIKAAKNFVVALKENRAVGGAETASALVARRLRERADVPFRDTFLGADTALVPVPRSSLRHKDALWPALEIAVSSPEDFTGIGSPCVGRITFRHGDCRRRP